MGNTSHNQQSSRAFTLAVAVLFWGLSIGFFIFGSRTWLPPLASEHGAGIDATLIFLLCATGTFFLVGHLVLGWAIWRFSNRSDVSMRAASVRFERRLTVAIGLVIVLAAEGGVLAIGMPAWKTFYVEQPPGDAIVVEVTVEQFAWNMRYPGPDGVFGSTRPELIDINNPVGIDPEDPMGDDDFVSINNLYVPANRAVKVRLRAKDVIHSFFLPHFRVKQDAVPGMVIDVWFTPTAEGRFEIACTELCGLGHYQMKGFLHIVPQAQYDAWLAEKTEQPQS
jgi:cytochrome c oxidase subunit 2